MTKSLKSSSKVKDSKSFINPETDELLLGRYKLLVDSIEDYAIYLLDTKGHVASWNPGAEKLKGYQSEEVLGQHFSVFFTEADKLKKNPENELKAAMSDGRAEYEGWRVRKDGSRFWANVVLTALYDDQGLHQGFAKVTRDLTLRKQYEDQLSDANVKLESSYRRLKGLNKAKDEFVSLASHQLRTPATGVKQYLLLLLEGYMGELTERQLDCIQKAYDSNDRQLEIVDDLLSVAQLDAGKVVLKIEPVLITNLIEDIVDEQADTLKKRRQSINLDLQTKSSLVPIDPVRFRMVLENLLDNASKYTPDGGKIWLSAKIERSKLIITVKDNGIGIEEKDIPKLFEKFTRISSRFTEKITGSGLGLYWAHKIVRLHNGKMEVSSKLKQGTIFKITLPIKESHGKNTTR